MSDGTHNEWDAIFADMDDDKSSYPEVRPKLAHYTSLATIETIVKSDEMWMSHPLLMNDVEELRTGLFAGADAFRQSDAVRQACRTPERHVLLLQEFEKWMDSFIAYHVFDVYILCLSEHEDDDGLLSMWRGYGDGGRGAAIVFDTAKIEPVEGSPLRIAKVAYPSESERTRWLSEKMSVVAQTIEQFNTSDDRLWYVARSLFDRILSFALFTKHPGFREEREWRLAYVGFHDSDHLMDEYRHYTIGRNGIEPKLRLKLAAIDGVTGEGFTLANMLSQIILGPSTANPLIQVATQRMLQLIGRADFHGLVRQSQTPYRAL